MIIYLIYDHINLQTLYVNEYGDYFTDVPPDSIIIESPSIDDAMQNVRQYRNSLLFACDWTMLPDAPITTQELAMWKQYRQNLRDLPANLVWNSTTWPNPPEPQKFIPDISPAPES